MNGTRPQSIVVFERLYLLAIVMEVADILLNVAAMPSSQLRLRMAAVVISALLVLLTSRRRQRTAGFILSALFVIGFPMVAGALQPSVPLEASLLILIQVALQAAALIFLFRPTSREWFAQARVSEGKSVAS